MAIKTIEKVKINGLNQAFGGYVYNVSYNPSFSDGPSTLVINFISETGTYVEPVLSVKQSYNIKIGDNINLDFYAISWRQNETPGGRTLEVKFIDASFILDKIFVGLHKQHGDANAAGGSGACLIIVGKELHPCDTNRDGVFDVTDLQYLTDACDPCPTCAPGRDPNTRCQNISDTQILDVAYNFSELITAIQAKGINLGNIPQTNDRYLSQYYGSLRSVLQNWGADYGFNFYWENNKLNFIDAKQKIVVNVNPPTNILLEKTSSKTLEGTVSRASISRYQRQGEEKQYNCEKHLPTILLPMLLKDLFIPQPPQFGRRWRTIYAEDQMDLTCVFAHYTQTLREGFWWFNQHQITGAHRALAKKDIPLTGYGDFQILQVISDSIDTTSNSAYTTLRNTLTEPELVGRFSKMNGYFMVISGQSKLLDQQYEYERKLSDEFVGRFFYRPYRPQICGGQFNQTKQVQIEGEGGSIDGRIYEAGENIKNAPIFKFDYDPDSTVGRMITKSIFMDSAEGYDISYAPPPPNDQLRHSIALIEREGKWFPAPADERIKPALKYYEDRSIHLMQEGKSDLLFQICPQYNNPNIRVEDLKIVVGFSGVFIGERLHGPNQLDVQTTTLQTLPDGTLRPLGLISNVCAHITVRNEEGILTIETPSQGISGGGVRIIQGLSGVVTIPGTISYEGYRVLLHQKYEQTVFIPKVQTIKQDGILTCADNTLSFDVNFRDINDTDIQILTTGLGCVPNSGIIQLAHDTFNNGLTFSIADPKEELTYSIAGIDIPNVGADLIKNGLVGLDISIGNDGVVSNYTFSSRPPQPPNLELVQRTLQAQRPPPIKV